MKMNMLKTALMVAVLASAGISTGSCKKSKDNDKACTATMASLSGTYRVTALKYKASSGAPEQDALPWRDDCENDDLITLKSDGTYTYKDAGTVCNPDGSYTGTWSVSGNTITSDGAIYGTIKSFDCSKLVYTSTGVMAADDQLTYTITKQ